VGPGSVSQTEIARQRRAKLAKRRITPPVAGPGSTGLGIGGSTGVVYAPQRVFGRTPNPNSALSGVNTPSYADKVFTNIDTMQFRDRLAPARAYYNSKGLDFNLNTKDMTSLIRSGFVTYGKGGSMRYPGLAVSSNVQALNELLRTNYTQRGNKWLRNKPNQELQVTPATIQYLAHGGIGGNPQGALDAVNRGDVTRSARSPALDMSGLPSKGKGLNKRVDYFAMGDKYAKDVEKDALWQSKIVKKIAKEGGSTLWNKIMTGKFSDLDVQNLRQFMYSPNGTYGDAQEKFIQETLLNNGGEGPASLLAERQQDTLNTLREMNIKKQGKEVADYSVAVKDMVDTHFNPAMPAQGQFDNLVAQIQGGMGQYIPTYVVDQIMRDGSGSYTPDSMVTGGKRFVPAPLRDFTDAQKSSLIDALVSAQESGLSIPAGLRQYIDPLLVGFEGQPVEDDDAPSDPTGSVINRGIGRVPILGPLMAAGAILDKTGAADSTTTQMMDLTNLSYLQPTQNPDISQWSGNLVKGIARAGTGFMPSMYYLATDPYTTGKAMAQDYQHTYSSWDNFTARLANDPLGPILDAVTLVSGLGVVAKAAQTASAAARLGKTGGFKDPFVGNASDATGPIMVGQEWKFFDPAYNPASDYVMPAGRQMPESGKGISRLEYSSLMRQWASGDEYAKLRLESVLTGGSNASNSLVMPNVMDRAAAFFEPRYKFITRDDGARVIVDKGRREAVQPVVEGTTIRFSGNPIARGAQKVFFSAQSRGGAMSPMIANIPLLGFNYRFNKLMDNSNLSEAEAIRRELGMFNIYTKTIDDMKLTDLEQQVVMDNVSGGTYSPAVYASINRRQLADEAKGLGGGERELLEAQLKRFEDPEFLRAYAEVKASLVDGASPRGIELSRVTNTLHMMLDKQNRFVSAMDSPAAIQAALTAYAPITTAARLLPKDILRDLGPDIDNLAMFNPNWGFAEQMKMYPENFVNEGGVFRPITKGDTDLMDMLKKMESDMAIIRQDQGLRNIAGQPFFIVDEVINDAATGAPLLVRGRRLVLDGNKLADHTLERKPLIDETPLLVPASTMIPVKGGGPGVSTLSRDQAVTQVEIGAVNALNKVYPNVRDFVDKISDRSVNTAETFKQAENRNIAVESGMLDYHLKTQFKAHAAYLQKRGGDSWEKFFETTATPVLLSQFDSKTMVRTSQHKLFTNKAQAEAYAQNYDSLGAVEPGIVTEVTVAGKPMFKATMRHFDAMKETIREQRTKILRGADDFEKDYVQTVKDIKFDDPNEIIMVVPRSTYNKFKASEAAVDAALKEVFAPTTRKAGNILSSIFKVGVLSLNPKWIGQSTIGSSMMVGLANPEVFPRVMAGLMQHVARKAKQKLTKSEADAFSNHVDDFEYMTRSMPGQFENIYGADIAEGFMQKLGDSRLARSTIYGGYSVVFAYERNMRVSLMRELAIKYPGFKSLMRSSMAERKAAAGLKDLGLETTSRFQAAFEMLRDPASPLYDPNFMNYVTHGADGVLGNYRNFTYTEKAVRDYLLPFYAWQRHSALFTKRLFQERPIAANAAYQMGNYGFERVVAAGGIPDWLYETVPMPDELERILELNPVANNRMGMGALSPFNSTTDAIQSAASLFAGQGVVASSKSLFDFTSPFINNIIAQSTGRDPRTGMRLSEEDRNRGFLDRTLGVAEGFPAISAIVNSFKSYDDLNARRGMNDPNDIFVESRDPDSKLSIPGEKLTEKFTPGSKAGLWNLVTPFRAMSLNAEEMVDAYQTNMREKGVYIPSDAKETTALEGHVRALLAWKRKRDFVEEHWIPVWSKDYPDVQGRVMGQLANEQPKLPKNFPRELFNQIMGS